MKTIKETGAEVKLYELFRLEYDNRVYNKIPYTGVYTGAYCENCVANHNLTLCHKLPRCTDSRGRIHLFAELLAVDTPKEEANEQED